MAATSASSSTPTTAEDERSKQQRDADKAFRNLEGQESGGMDSSAAALAMQNLGAESIDEEAASKERLRALAAVAVEKADVDLVAKYFRMTVVEADRALRLNGGNLETTLRTLCQ
jgi:NACalpha-BTF3-like transcription factor